VKSPRINAFGIAILLVAGGGLAAGSQSSGPAQTQEVGDFAYHDHPPSEPLPKTLEPPAFSSSPKAHVAYCLASRVRDVLYQEPCFCHCNRFADHKSLLDCYTQDHGLTCYACQAEAIFCFEKHSKGFTPEEIRKALYRDEWRSLNLDEYAHTFHEREQKGLNELR